MEGKTLPVTHVLRRQHGFMKSIAAVVLVAFTSLYLQPLAIAAQLPPAAPAARTAPASNEEKLARTLEDIEIGSESTRTGSPATKMPPRTGTSSSACARILTISTARHWPTSRKLASISRTRIFRK